MSIQPVYQGTFSFLQNLPIVIEASAARLSSDAGLLAIREFDECIGLTPSLAAILHDPRDPKKFDHSFLDMSRARIYGILADYVDQNDHDTLRSDPVFKLIANRLPDLVSQTTLSRFENTIDIPSLKRLREQFVDQFIASFVVAPRRLTFDLDAVDDPTHGHQQLSLFHGYFEQYQYFPSFITSADNDRVVVLSLRPGVVHAALGPSAPRACLNFDPGRPSRTGAICELQVERSRVHFRRVWFSTGGRLVDRLRPFHEIQNSTALI